MHAHTTGQDRRAAGMGTGDEARKSLAWLAASASPALTAGVRAWLRRPACSIPDAFTRAVPRPRRAGRGRLSITPPKPASPPGPEG